jgi:hypothetical protein
MSNKIIGVESDGVIEWHAPGVAGPDYATLCGLDGNDDAVGQRPVDIKPPRGTKIDCHECKRIWAGVRDLKLRESDFA